MFDDSYEKSTRLNTYMESHFEKPIILKQMFIKTQGAYCLLIVWILIIFVGSLIGIKCCKQPAYYWFVLLLNKQKKFQYQ